MKLAIVNGSPRGRTSNSTRIINWITKGMDNVEKVYAADIKTQDEAVENVLCADSILFVFPLYTDAMPGLTKAFMEKMAIKDFGGKTITFVIHSGFPEAVHLRTLQKYCAYFAKTCGMKLLGCAVIGGSEGGVASDKRADKDKRVKALKEIGSCIAEQKEIGGDILKALVKVESFGKLMLFIIKLMPMDIIYNRMFKKSGVLEKIYDKPYIDT